MLSSSFSRPRKKLPRESMMTSLTLFSGMKFEDDRCFSVKIKYVGEKGKVVHVVSDDRLEPKIYKRLQT